MKISPQTQLLAVNGALLAGIVAVWSFGAMAWTEPAEVAPDAASLAPRSIAKVEISPAIPDTIAARPLFASDRRPLPTTTAAAPSEEVGAFQNMHLLGVLGSGDQSVVIIHTGTASKRVKTGEKLDGWTLQAIDGRVARFVGNGGEVRELFLAHAVQRPNPQAPAAAVNSPPPPPQGGTAAAQALGTQVPNANPAQQRSIEELIAERRARREAAAAASRARSRAN